MTGVGLQGTTVLTPNAKAKESMKTWKDLGVNTLVWAGGFEKTGTTEKTSGVTEITNLGAWLSTAQNLGLNWILPIHNVRALSDGFNGLLGNALRDAIHGSVKIDEWQDHQHLVAVSVMEDEPNGGVPPDAYKEQPEAVLADIQMIHSHKQKAWVNVTGQAWTFPQKPGDPPSNSNPLYVQQGVDIISEDFYPVNFGFDKNMIGQILDEIKRENRAVGGNAELQVVLEASDQNYPVSYAQHKKPTPAQM